MSKDRTIEAETPRGDKEAQSHLQSRSLPEAEAPEVPPSCTVLVLQGPTADNLLADSGYKPPACELPFKEIDHHTDSSTDDISNKTLQNQRNETPSTAEAARVEHAEHATPPEATSVVALQTPVKIDTGTGSSTDAMQNAGVPSTSQSVAPATGDDNEQFLRTIATDILDKQYRLYVWNDAKNQALITTNALLFAAVGFVYKDAIKDKLAIYVLALAVSFLAVSLLFGLRHVIPRISSGRTGKEPNTRSLRGIALYNTFDDYYAAYNKTTKETILKDTLRQVYGMSINNRNSARIITIGALLTMIGSFLLLTSIYITALSARGHSMLGSWQVEMPPAKAAPYPMLTSPQISAQPTNGATNSIPLVRFTMPAIPAQKPNQP